MRQAAFIAATIYNTATLMEIAVVAIYNTATIIEINAAAYSSTVAVIAIVGVVYLISVPANYIMAATLYSSGVTLSAVVLKMRVAFLRA